MRIVVGITGASGVIYGIRLLDFLKNTETFLIISENAKQVIEIETGYDLKEIEAKATHVFANNDFTAPVCSGSFLFEGAIIAPCSMKTLGNIANGISSTLIERVAEVCLKENRRLVLVTRETPLSEIHLENMLRVRRAGAVVMPACPAFYNKPRSVLELVDFVIARALDAFGIHLNTKRWGEQKEKQQEQERKSRKDAWAQEEEAVRRGRDYEV